MTVGIGAICEKGVSAVVAADKMVTFGSPMNLQTEPPALKKIIELTERVVLVFSGGTADGEEIIAATRPRLTDPIKQSVGKIAAVVRDSYAEHKQRRAEETILRPLLGADFRQFQTLVAQSPTSQILQQILGALSQHNLQTEVLVAGLDDSGAQVFAVTHPGQLLSLATTGFGSIGSGGLHAGVRMSLARHTKAAPLAETVYNVYEAKRASEVAPGVGNLTDLAIIRGNRIFFADGALLKALETAHKEKPALNADELKKLRQACDECTKQALAD